MSKSDPKKTLKFENDEQYTTPEANIEGFFSFLKLNYSNDFIKNECNALMISTKKYKYNKCI